MNPEAKPSCYCAAHGCILLGVMSTNTTGTNDWWCYLHFGKDAVQLQAVTVEINKREWLAKAITDIRMTYATTRWADTFRSVVHELKMAQRGDLLKESHETVQAWVLRLENTLAAMCGGRAINPPRQERIEVEGLQKVAFPVPE